MPSTRIVLNGPVFLVSNEPGVEGLDAAITKLVCARRTRSRRAASDLTIDSSDDDFVNDASEEDAGSTTNDDSDVDQAFERDSRPARSKDGAIRRHNDASSQLAPLSISVTEVGTKLPMQYCFVSVSVNMYTTVSGSRHETL